MSDINDKMDAIRARLSSFYDDSVSPWQGGGGLDGVGSPMDSLTAVDSLLLIDEIVGRRIPMRVVQVGGYDSKEEFVNGMADSVRSYLEGKI